jgi:hypothetical protein
VSYPDSIIVFESIQLPKEPLLALVGFFPSEEERAMTGCLVSYRHFYLGTLGFD